MQTTLDLDTVYLMDDDGNEVEMTVLFTYNDEETNIDYIVLYEDDETKELDDIDFYTYRYKIIHNEGEDDVIDLDPVEDENELNKMSEIINQYFDDLEEAEEEK